MKKISLIAMMLAAGMMSGCILIQVNSDSKPKHHKMQKGERDEEKDEEDSRGEKRSGKESREEMEENEDHESGEGKKHTGEAGEKAEKEDSKGSPAKLMARAKVSESKARALALAKVPGGTIKEGGLEEENGKLIWSFDIATPGAKDITEVAVDAITGKILAVSKESPAEQAKEREDDQKEEKKKSGQD